MQTTPLELLANTTGLPDSDLLASLFLGAVVSSPLTVNSPTAQAIKVSEDFFNSSTISSNDYNSYFSSVVLDISRLFAAANDNDKTVSALEKLGNDNLDRLTAQVDRLEQLITAAGDLQTGYNSGYTISNRVDFIDDSAIEQDPAVIGSSINQSQYDPNLQAIALTYSKSEDTLHTSTSSILADANIDLQLGLPVKAYEHLRTPAHAIDSNSNSYWGEVVLIDQPVTLTWPPINSVYQNAVVAGAINTINSGAVCEYTINYHQPTAWNSLLIKPFCEFPINLAAVIVTKVDTGSNLVGETRFVQGGNIVNGDGTLASKFWLGNSSFWYPTLGGDLPSIPTAVGNYGPIYFGYSVGNPFPTGIQGFAYFYARFTGYLYAPTTGTYTVGAVADDGVNIYVGNNLVVSNLGATLPNLNNFTYTGTVNLQGNTWYPIIMEYQQTTGNAICELIWTVPGGISANIPSSNLSSVRPYPTNTILPVDSTIPAGYVRSVINEYASNRTNGNLYMNQTQRLFFPTQEETTSITLVFHQPHYTREIFNLDINDSYQDSLWQQMLGNTPLLGLPNTPTSIASSPTLNLTFTSPNDIVSNLATAIGSTLDGHYTSPIGGTQTFAKYQYTYGAYNIEVEDQRYQPNSQFISKPITSTSNLIQSTLIGDYDLPFSDSLIATSFFGTAPIPTSWSVPSATIAFDLTFGKSEPWYPLIPLDESFIHEAFIPTLAVSQVSLRLTPQPNTPVYFTSFDGLGNSTLIGGVLAPGATNIVSTGNYLLQTPGYYIISYTPIDQNHYVNFGQIAESSNSLKQETFSFTGNQVDVLRGIQLPSDPFIDTNQISADYVANGNPLYDYVPLQVSISNLSIIFPDIVDSSGKSTTLTSFTQNTNHGYDLYLSIQSRGPNGELYEILTSSDANQLAAVNFRASHQNWDQDTNKIPLLFSIDSAGIAHPLNAIDVNGNTVWVYNPTLGTVRFVNKNVGIVGNIGCSYWYLTTSFNTPTIIDRTDYSGRGDVALTSFDSTSYPIIEYTLASGKLYFNLTLPSSANVKVTYGRLFDTCRVRATFNRVDPINESATPHLYGYTFLARDANTTSLEVQEYPEVVWGNLEVTKLTSTTQLTPAISLVPGDSNYSSSVPVARFVNINWYRIINAGSVKDYLRSYYDINGGDTFVAWDENSDCYLENDGAISQNVSYTIMDGIGNNYIPIEAGASVIVGIFNFVTGVNPVPATIYSSQNSQYAKCTSWSINGTIPNKDQSVSAVTIS